jgi:hypothetical protein
MKEVVSRQILECWLPGGPTGDLLGLLSLIWYERPQPQRSFWAGEANNGFNASDFIQNAF